MEGNLTSRDWTGVPLELLHLISGKLSDILDFVRFRAVCKTWQASAPLSDPPPQLPWLLDISNISSTSAELPEQIRFHTLSSHETSTVATKPPSECHRGKCFIGRSCGKCHSFVVTYSPSSYFRQIVFSMEEGVEVLGNLKSDIFCTMHLPEGESAQPLSKIYHIKSAEKTLRVHVTGFPAQFCISQEDFDEQKNDYTWTQVYSIGDQVLYLNDIDGFSVSSTPLGGPKGNCIYFFGLDRKPYKYDIENSTVKKLQCPFEKSRWFIPKLYLTDC